MTQFVMGPDNVVQMLPDDAATDPISQSLQQQGIYQSPEGWAIVTGSPGGQLGGAPRIILDTNGKQPPADVLARYPMASPQEQAGFQQQAAQYRAGEGKPVSMGQAILAAAGAYFGGQALGNFLSPAAAAVPTTVTPPSSFLTLAEGGNTVSDAAPIAAGAGPDTVAVPDWSGEDLAVGQAQLSNAGYTPASFNATVPNTFPAAAAGAAGGAAAGAALTPAQAVAGAGVAAGAGGGGTGAMDQGGSAGVFDSSGNPLYKGVDPSLLKSAADFLGVSPDTLMKTLGAAAPGLIGALASSNQTSAYKDLAQQFAAYGAPSRARYEASYAPGFTMASDPGYQGALDASAKASAHALSVNGNPAGSPNAWEAIQKDVFDKTAYPAIQNYRTLNANAGGISSFNAAAPTAASNVIGSNTNMFNSLGAAANNIFNPPQTLADQLKAFKTLSG